MQTMVRDAASYLDAQLAQVNERIADALAARQTAANRNYSAGARRMVEQRLHGLYVAQHDIERQRHSILTGGLRVVVQGSSFDVDDFARASYIYSRLRDKSGEGASTFAPGKVYRGDVLIARVSYNGRVWDLAASSPDSVPLYAPVSA
jgi:hypothetical protein